MEDIYLKKILDKVHAERGLNFSQYRMKLLSRRVMARVRLTKRDDFEQYYAHLNRSPEEMDYLLDALTINVTEFFRDEFVFDVIEKKVIPELFNKKRDTVRIWSCACSSGEEPYSILIAIAEFLGLKLPEYKLRIVATDIDEKTLMHAIQGVYDKTQFQKLPPHKLMLLDKYFYKMETGKYWIREEWAGYIEFKYHDMVADPPLERMDMVLCRNVLMYFNRELQSQVIGRLYNALNHGGFLILGNVESVPNDLKDKFYEYDRKARIYIKK